jgi:hypothetical protein
MLRFFGAESVENPSKNSERWLSNLSFYTLRRCLTVGFGCFGQTVEGFEDWRLCPEEFDVSRLLS